MRAVGIESITAFCGLACVEVDEVFRTAGLDPSRTANLLMRRKTVALPCEDAVTYAVNAAAPLLAALDPDAKAGIELLVIGTESGLDYSKSLGTWVHRLLDLPASCRVVEVKQACYAGIAALQSAAAALAVSRRDTPRALVIGTDVPRLVRGTLAEPSQGAGAVAVLLSTEPRSAVADLGAAGYHSFEVDDFLRPTAVDHVVDTDLSLVSYLACLKGAYADYLAHHADPPADFRTTFDRLVFHTPFPGAVKGFHRALMRSQGRFTPQDVEADFDHRVEESIRYPALVGNIYAGTALLALLSLLDHLRPEPRDRRIGIFSYGSGCSSELCAYTLPAGAGPTGSGLDASLRARERLDLDAYHAIARSSLDLHPGTAHYTPDLTGAERLAATRPGPLVVLEAIRDHRRTYTTLGAP